jgi:hypothetical protein
MANNTHTINLAFVIHDVFLIILLPKQLNLVGSIVPPNKCVAWFPSSLLLGSPFSFVHTFSNGIKVLRTPFGSPSFILFLLLEALDKDVCHVGVLPKLFNKLFSSSLKGR